MSGTYIDFLKPFEKGLKKKTRKKGLTIAVGGLSASGKTTAAKALAREFHLKYISAGKIFRQMAKQRKISLEKFSEIREKEIDHELDKKMLHAAMKSGVVLDGRLTAWDAGNWADVKIFYETNLDVRALRSSKRDKVSLSNAKKNIFKRDREDSKKYKKLYGINLFDKSIYDIIINNNNLSMKEAKSVPIILAKRFLKKSRKF